MTRHTGTRFFNGREYLLNGFVTGYTAEDAQENAAQEAARLRAQGKLVRMIKTGITEYKIYIHG